MDRLENCGWSSFDASLFARDAHRIERDVADALIAIARDFSPGPRILELCCGTGRVCIELAQAGYDVTGVDLSEDMLLIFRDLIARQSPEVRQRLIATRGDVCTLALGREFDFVLLEDDSFVYLHTHDDQIACLRAAAQHLAPEGRFLLRFTTPQKELLADEEYEYDELRQIKTSPCRWTVKDDSGEERVVQQGVQRRRLTWPMELELLIRSAGLAVCERWGDLERNPLTDPEWQEYCYLLRHA